MKGEGEAKAEAHAGETGKSVWQELLKDAVVVVV